MTAVLSGQTRDVFIESQPVEGERESGRYLIRAIRAGKSVNGNYYTDAVLREAAPLFDGVRVIVKSDSDHLAGAGRDVRNLVGVLSEPTFVEGASADTGEVRARLDVLSASPVAATLREAVERGMAGDLFGFSIDAVGTAKRRGLRLREATKITKINSLDLIVEPSAGGEVIGLIEAARQETDDMLRAQMIEAIEAANDGAVPADVDIDNEQALLAAYREAVAPAADAGDNAKPAAIDTDAVEQRLRLIEARAEARIAIAESDLPDIAKTRLREDFARRADFREADVTAAIDAEREYLATFVEAGKPTGLGGARVTHGEDRSDKIAQMFDDFFDPAKPVNSFRECYVEVTGDRRVSGDLRDCDPVRLREAAGNLVLREAVDTSVFAQVLGDAMQRRLLADYATPRSRYDQWRDLASVVPVSDFRTQHRPRIGGYGDLPSVAQGAPYAALVTPGDEEATYSIAKKGGIETVTMEAIRNDDAGVIQRIPTKLSAAAQRTLAKFVLDMLATNPTIYDGQAAFHVAHNNLSTAALDATSLAAARRAVLAQQEAGSNERIGIPPVHLWVPIDLEETAFDLFRRQTNNDTDFVESLNMRVHPVWYWTDANDWAVTVDPNEMPFIEMAFLDGNQQPELFVQDSPTNGSLFTNDQITYKIRHIYGGAWVDFRGAHKSVVA